MSEPATPPLGLRPHWRRATAWLGIAAAAALMVGLHGVDRERLSVSSPSSDTPRGRIAQQATDAERLMRRAEDVIRDAKSRAGVHPDAEAADDASGLLGAELTPLVTTLGALDAKRTATNPRWANVLTRQLADAGIGHGDVVAASFSGSFPGLNLAVMCATQTLGADLLAVSSISASTWGANQPGFTWPEIEARLVEAGVLRRASIAISAGGDGDRGPTLDPEGPAMAERILTTVALSLDALPLRPSGFQESVRQRMALYRRVARGRPIALYINVGGASASLGRSPAILRYRSGFIAPRVLDRSNERGVTARFAEEGVRILMLLNVRELALRWGLQLAGRLE
jgi:poly-gamma-glutamate system protein